MYAIDQNVMGRIDKTLYVDEIGTKLTLYENL